MPSAGGKYGSGDSLIISSRLNNAVHQHGGHARNARESKRPRGKAGGYRRDEPVSVEELLSCASADEPANGLVTMMMGRKVEDSGATGCCKTVRVSSRVKEGVGGVGQGQVVAVMWYDERISTKREVSREIW